MKLIHPGALLPFHRLALAAPSLALACALTTSSCSGEGQLGQTALSAPCAAGDESCRDHGDVSSPIAAGAVFSLVVTPVIAGGTAIPLTLKAVDETVASVDDAGKIHAVAPGVTAVLVLADDGGVVDFTHVAVAKAARVTFHRGGGSDVDDRELPNHIQVFPSEDLTLTVRVWQSGQQLIGEMGDAWSVDDNSFLVVDQGFAEERIVRAPASGTATVTVDLLGISQTLTLEVVP